jgi:hypothetical protein
MKIEELSVAPAPWWPAGWVVLVSGPVPVNLQELQEALRVRRIVLATGVQERADD